MSLKADVMVGLKWTAGAKFGGQLITWGITIVVMRLLMPADYGLLAMASVLIVFMNMVAEAGLGQALVQSAAVSTRELRQALGIFLLINWLLCALLNLLAPLVAVFYEEPKLVPVLRVLSLQFLFTPWAVVSEVLLQRRLDYKKRSLVDLSTAIVTSVTTLVLALGHCGVWSLILGNVGATVWRTGLVNWVSPFRHWPLFSWRGMRLLLSFGGKVTASRFLWVFFSQADVIIVGRMLGNDVLGTYSVAMHLASMPVQRVSSILNQVAFPAFARHQQDSRPQLAEHLLKALGLISFAAFPLLWGLSCTASDLVPVLLGPEWKGAVLPLQVLALMMPFRTVVGFLPTLTDAIGRPGVSLQNVLLSCVVMPPALYVGAHWGILGVAAAWVLIYPLVLIVNTRRMVAVVGLGPLDVGREIAPAMFCAGLMAASVWAVQTALRNVSDRHATLVVEIAAGVAVYFLAAWLFNRTTLRQIASIGRRRSAA